MTTARLLRRGLLSAAAFAAATRLASAAEMADPGKQSDVFKRIFSYDKDLRASEKIVVIIVGASRQGGDVDKVAGVFREKGLYPAVVTPADLTDDLTATMTSQSAVIYVMPGVANEPVKAFAEKKGFLSISGVASLAESGHVAVSVDIRNGRSEIVVNMARLESERHELSSELLNLARVIR
jgi:hypothetical protein